MRIYLNVYDLSSLNRFGRLFGLGIYHSAIEINGNRYTGIEFAYGFSSHDQTGVSATYPGVLPGAVLYQRVNLGETHLSLPEIQSILSELSDLFRANEYHLLLRNCNHYCNELCLRLFGKNIPNYVNRSAGIIHCMSCVVPPAFWDNYISNIEKKPLLSKYIRSS